jgi:hypothetical protein
VLAELNQDLLSSHSSASSIREQALFHLLLGKLMAARWQQGCHDIEVLKSEVDRGGYDIVLEANGVLRHIQLKSTLSGSAVRPSKARGRSWRRFASGPHPDRVRIP